LSKNTISIHLRSPDDYVSEYVASIILGFNALIAKPTQGIAFGKVKGVYWSRLCQNIKDIVRKPAMILLQPNPDPKHVTVLEGTAYECSEEVNNDRKYIGFLSKPYELSGTCLPCCFITSQINKRVYKKCTDDIVITSLTTPRYSLFILDSSRLIGNNRLGYLDSTIDDFLNHGNKIVVYNKLLIETSGYLLVSGNDLHHLDSDILEDSIIDYIDLNPQHILIDKTTFYTSPYLNSSENISYYQILKDLLFEIVMVFKTKSNDILKISHSYPIIKALVGTRQYEKITERLVIKNFITIPNITEKEEAMIKDRESNSIHIVYNFNSSKLQSK